VTPRFSRLTHALVARSPADAFVALAVTTPRSRGETVCGDKVLADCSTTGIDRPSAPLHEDAIDASRTTS
jgi:hypothetical protein